MIIVCKLHKYCATQYYEYCIFSNVNILYSKVHFRFSNSQEKYKCIPNLNENKNRTFREAAANYCMRFVYHQPWHPQITIITVNTITYGNLPLTINRGTPPTIVNRL